MAKVLNIEVGDRVTKVCVSEKNKKNYQISKCFLIQTPVGAVRDGQIMQVDVMAAALREALKEHGLTAVKKVTFTLASTKVASREVLLPPVKDNRIKALEARVSLFERFVSIPQIKPLWEQFLQLIGKNKSRQTDRDR